MMPATLDPVKCRRGGAMMDAQEYDRLIELGVLHEDERIELIGGQMAIAVADLLS